MEQPEQTLQELSLQSPLPTSPLAISALYKEGSGSSLLELIMGRR